jgi:hypothetical protein
VKQGQDFYTVAEIALRLRVRESAVRARLGRNDPTLPPSIRVGGRRLFPIALYEEWLQELLRGETDSVEGQAAQARINAAVQS